MSWPDGDKIRAGQYDRLPEFKLSLEQCILVFCNDKTADKVLAHARALFGGPPINEYVPNAKRPITEEDLNEIITQGKAKGVRIDKEKYNVFILEKYRLEAAKYVRESLETC